MVSGQPPAKRRAVRDARVVAEHHDGREQSPPAPPPEPSVQ